MDYILHNFTSAHQYRNGYQLASSITPANPNDLHAIATTSPDSDSVIADIRYATIYSSTIPFSRPEAEAWFNILAAYHNAVCAIVAAEEAVAQIGEQSASAADRRNEVYRAWWTVADTLIKGYTGGARFASWTIPCLYVAGKYLRLFAIKADEAAAQASSNGEAVTGAGGVAYDEDLDVDSENEKLQDAARLINRIFACCIGDRSPVEESRKWALYYTANLMFKTYFKLNQLALTKNILSALSASRDTPPITAYPKSHRTTFHYYHGVILFLSEDYAAAETALTSALSLCPLPRSRTATTSPAASMAITKNRTLILTYLIPCRLLTSHKLPSGKLLAVYPELARLFGPLCKCIRNGDLKGFDDALAAGEAEFVKRRVYLTLERGRDIALRNVLRKVVGAEMDENGTRRARVRIEEFVAGLRIANGRAGGDAVMRGLEDGGEDAEDERDEVECFIANAIYKNLMKGYIARDRGMVALSKSGAFPGTGV